MNVHVSDHDTSCRTLADVLATVSTNRGLSEIRRRDLASAIKSAARLLKRNPSEIGADTSLLRERLAAIHPEQAGISAKRLANIKADLAAALRVALLTTRRPRRVHRTPEWETLLASLEQPWQRYSLSRLATFCSMRRIAPIDVDDLTIGMFRAHLSEASLAKDPNKACKITIQTWNRVINRLGLPLKRLTCPRSDRYRTAPLSEYPESFQADVDAWIKRCTHVDLFSEDGPPRQARPQTLKNHRHIIRQFAAAVVARGHAIEDITSLSTLVELGNLKEGLRFFIDRNSGQPPTWLSVMMVTLLAIARYHVKAPQEQIDAIRKFKAQITVKHVGMTEKNTKRLAQFEDRRNVDQLFKLPRLLVDRAAQSNRESSRVALDVMLAVAIEILIACPMRVGNLATLDIERHFSWRGQGNSQIVALAIPGSEVKNEQPIEADFPLETTRLLRNYLKTYRPLLSENPGDWLFPNRIGGHRNPSDLSKDVSRVVRRETGLIMNAHLFRHLAGMLILQRHPGSYELVRRLLGHRTINTTINFYTSLESKWAFKHYDDTILSKRGKHDA